MLRGKMGDIAFFKLLRSEHSWRMMHDDLRRGHGLAERVLSRRAGGRHISTLQHHKDRAEISPPMPHIL